MKKTYHVKLEPSTVWGKDVEVEAESMSEAVKIAKEKLCGKEQVEVSYHPTCVQPKPEDADEDYELYEYDHSIYGECDDCGIILFEDGSENPDNDWPWQVAAGDTRHHTYICYPCAMKRKEVGNYCPFFKHFYRSYKEGCDKCPPECTRARDAYFEKLKGILTKALRLSSAPNKAVEHFLGHNEFGLAHETLQECKARDSRDSSNFAKRMKEAADLMAEGWQ